MTRPPARRQRFAASTLLLACQVLAITLGILDLASNAWQHAGEPPVILLSILALASIIAATRRPALGVCLALLPLATAPLFPTSGHAILPLLATTAAAMVRWRARAVLLLAAGYTTLVVTDAVLLGAPARTLTYTTVLAAGLAMGWALRVLVHRSRRGAARVAGLERRVAAIRRDERASLADELSQMLVDGLEESAFSLQHALPSADATELTEALASVEQGARTALGRLRHLVSTLRAGPDPTGDRVELATAIEGAEDLLVGHGHPVALETAGVPDWLAGERARLVVDCLREAVDHVREHAPAGAACTIAVSTADDSLVLRVEHPLPGSAPGTLGIGLRRATERVERLGGSLRVVADGSWALTATVPLRPTAAGPAPAPVPRAPRTWVPLDAPGLGRMVVALPAVVALAREVPLTLTRAAAGIPGWTDGIWWSLLWLGIAATAWSARAGAAVLAVGLATGIVSWSGLPDFVPAAPQVSLAFALTVTVAARRPGLTFACLAAWAAYLPLWSRGGLDAGTALALFVVPCLGALVGLVVHHFVSVRADQLADLARLHAEQQEARALERHQLAGELHDIVAHQLSLVGLRIMGLRDSTDVGELRRGVQQVASITASARADLATLVHVMRAHHEAASADRAEVGRATWLTPSAAAEGVATTLRQAGHPVTVSTAADADACDATTHKTVSRILREATTNILRYAPDGGACHIEVSGTERAIEVVVSSPLPATPVVDPLSTGYGLLGLQERAALTGGDFAAGPRDERWVVRATLPRWGAGPALLPRSGAERWQGGRVDDAELDRAHEHLRARPHPELLGDAREVLLH